MAEIDKLTPINGIPRQPKRQRRRPTDEQHQESPAQDEKNDDEDEEHGDSIDVYV